MDINRNAALIATIAAALGIGIAAVHAAIGRFRRRANRRNR